MKGPFGRRDRLIQERHHNIYRDKERWPEPTRCCECGAVFSGGRWTWKDLEGKANETTCPACLRIAHNFPAGYIQLKGDFFLEHETEIMNLIKNVENLQKGNYPLERIMDIISEEDHTLVTTTGIHIARRIGEALSRSYQGNYSFQYGDGEKLIRVYWER